MLTHTLLFACVPRLRGLVVGSRSATLASTFRSATTAESGELKKRVLVPIADGSEEIETTCIQDTLVRAGADVVVASANAQGSLTVTMSRGIKIMANIHVDSVGDDDWDLVAIPGGMPGAKNLANSDSVARIVRRQAASAKAVAAVCASPAVVLEPLGVLVGKSATCYPAPQFVEALGDKAAPGDVVVDGNVITSRGPGTSLKFALSCVAKLYGEEKSAEVAKQMLVDL